MASSPLTAITLPVDVEEEEDERSRHEEVIDRVIKDAQTTPKKGILPVRQQGQRSSTPKKTVPLMQKEEPTTPTKSTLVKEGQNETLYTRRVNLPPALDDATSPKTLGLVEQVYKIIHHYFTHFRSSGQGTRIDLDTVISQSQHLAASPDMTTRRHALSIHAHASTLFVSKWIDYSQKYGLGYQLTDGCTGVFFNDSSTMLVAANNKHLEYLDYVKKNGRMMMQRQNFGMDSVPSRVEKKWKLFHHFRGYMQDKLYQVK